MTKTIESIVNILSMDIFDSLPNALLVVHDTVRDTVFVLRDSIGTQEKSSTDKIIDWIVTLASSSVGALIAILGWKKVSHLQRENQKKGFEEGVYDKTRLELNGPLTEYRDWLHKVKLALWEISNLVNWVLPKLHTNQVEGDPLNPRDYTIGKVYRDIIHLIEPLKPIVAEGDQYNWFHRFDEYDLFYPNMKEVVRVMRIKHVRLNGLMRRLFEEPPNSENAIMHIGRILHRVLELILLRNQFFQFLQYESLSSMDKIKAPVFPPDPNLCTIGRDSTTGVYSIILPKATT